MKLSKEELTPMLRHDDEIPALEADQGRYLGFVRLVARRRL